MTDERSTHGASGYQRVLDGDAHPAPPPLRVHGQVEYGTGGVARTRYVDREFLRLEHERLWPRVWQMACREEQIADPGQVVVYEVGDLSLLVVRSDRDTIHAFHNSCLHRGTQLRTADGTVERLRCPFHGFTWDLDGTMCELPCAWDFPHTDPAALRLPEAQVATWGGFVFVNPDPDAPPLAEHLGSLPEHFARFPLEDRYTAAHVAKVLECNWKVGLEAFIEAFHTFAVHPQLVTTSGDTITQYDVLPGERWSRMVTPVGVPSEHVTRDVTDSDILRSMLITREDGEVEVPEGSTVRGVLADRMRADLAARTGRDFSHLSDAEALDGIEYFVFPNFFPWAGFLTPLVYRFRPWGDDPGRCLMEVMLLEPLPTGERRPPPAPLHFLRDDERFADAPELGYIGPILDQDTRTVARVQRGLRASQRAETLLAHTQEVRIRHFHHLLAEYVGDDAGTGAGA